MHFPESRFVLIILFDQLCFMFLLFYDFGWTERILHLLAIQLMLKFLQYGRVLHWVIIIIWKDRWWSFSKKCCMLL